MTESEKLKIKELYFQNYSYREIAEELGMAKEKIRAHIRRQSYYKPVPSPETVDKKTYREDGSVTSYITTKLSDKKLFSPEELLEIHGFDPIEFKIKTVTSNEWQMTNGEGIKYYNFQSKIIAEPANGKEFTIDTLVETIQNYTKPFDIEVIDDEKVPSTLLIALPDLHFGINTADDYAEYQDGILRLIETQYQTVVISLLGDTFNSDQFQSKTIHDTRVADTDMPNAWEEATLFLEPIIQSALANSPDVTIVYSRGNHDESISWAYSKYLEVKYPQANVDVGTEQLKCVLVNDNAIYLTHGHIRKRNFVQLCATLYPKEWATATNRMLFTGHYHFIKSEDLTGIVHYQLPTPSRDTEYEEEHLFLGSKKGIHVFELGDDRVNAIYYL